MTENELSKIVFDAGLKVHRTLGPGLLESAYEACLHYEILKQGIAVERQIGLPIIYDEVKLDTAYRLDLILENKLIIEIKAVENLHPLHQAQMITYLRLSGCKLGMLINFNTVLFKDGVKRVINGIL